MTDPNLPPPDPIPAHQLSDADMRVLDFLAEHGFDASRIELLPPEDRPRAMVLIRQMQVLDRYPSAESDDSLVDATLARIDRWEASASSMRIEERRVSRFRLSDFVSVAALVMVGLGVLLPIASRVRQQSLSTVCAGNMRSLHGGLDAYARDNGGSLPLSASVLGGLESLFSRKPQVAATAPRREAGGTAPLPAQPTGLDPAMAIRPPVMQWTFVRVTDRGISVVQATQDWSASNHGSHLGMLVAHHYAGAQALKCPACAAGAPCFAYRVPVRGQRFAIDSPGRMVIVGDANPLIDNLRAGLPTGSPTMNSHNHRGEGQNLLFTDGSVDWATSPVLPAGGDNIWLRGDGRIPDATLRGWPVDPNDTFLAH